VRPSERVSAIALLRRAVARPPQETRRRQRSSWEIWDFTEVGDIVIPPFELLVVRLPGDLVLSG